MTKKKVSGEGAPKRRRRQNDAIADWGGIEPELLQCLIERVTAQDGAVRFGYSRDGGAYSVGIYGDGKPFTEFCPATGDVDTWLAGLVEDYS